MSIYLKKRQWKLAFWIVAMIIVAGSLYYTHNLVDHLSKEERKKIELWAEGIKMFNLDTEQDVFLMTKILENNETIPVILVDERDSIIDYLNISVPRKNADRFLRKQLENMRQEKEPIAIELVNSWNYIYYNDSSLLVRLSYYPYVQLGVIILFIVMGYFAFSYSKRAEQNQVWVGMSKETAHQLGTPISSLMAWVELLKEKDLDSYLMEEIDKDVNRLRIIAERFSKIGSTPVMEPHRISKVLDRAVEYIRSRSSSKVEFQVNYQSNGMPLVPLNPELFEWVIENLCKNAVDAMNGVGRLKIDVEEQTDYLVIDIADTGKGISRKHFKTVFEPGFTTKKRGWGLGLSLAKRIIENYHSGKIFVRNSELRKGTIFRILLRKSFKAF
ncbi:MAG: ATP-binding protein [Marinifilaceae bacterium]